MGFFSNTPPKQQPRDKARVLAASEHVDPIRHELLTLDETLEGHVLLAPKEGEDEETNRESSEAYHKQRERAFFHTDCNYPSAIILAESVEDVVKVIRTIKDMDREHYKLGIAGGCHSSFCMVDQTLVLDLEKLNKVSVDEKAKTMEIGGGAKIEVAHKALRGKNLGFVTGTNGDTGVSGLTLAGGAGYLGGQGGFACDTVLSAKVVLPSGDVVTATDTNEHKNLLRALRGGGGNFGVVVEWTFRLFDVSNCFGGTVVHFAPSLKNVKQVFDNYANVLQDNMPDSAYSICAFPAGAPVFVNVATVIGDDDVKEAKSYSEVPFLSRISSLGAWFRVTNTLGRKDYIDEVTVLLEQVQQRSHMIVLGVMIYCFDEAIRDAIIHFTRVDYPKKNAKPTLIVMSINGEMRRNDGSKSSIRHRKAEAWVLIEGRYEPHATKEQIGAVEDWAERVKKRLLELGGEDGPHNFCDTDGRRIKFFTDEQRTFLEEAKNKYDPSNLFSLNKNIHVYTE